MALILTNLFEDCASEVEIFDPTRKEMGVIIEGGNMAHSTNIKQKRNESCHKEVKGPIFIYY